MTNTNPRTVELAIRRDRMEAFERAHAESYDTVSEHYPYALPSNAQVFHPNAGTPAVKRWLEDNGNFYFGPQDMRFFDAIVLPHLYGRRFFVESTQQPAWYDERPARVWRVSYVVTSPNGSRGVEHFADEFENRVTAIAFAQEAARVFA